MDKPPAIVTIFTGDGKGKTTAAIGQIIRACGAGWRVGLVRLLKNNSSSEMVVLNQLPELKIINASPNLQGFCSDLPAGEQQEIVNQSHGALAEAARWLKDKELDLLVIDEAVVAIDLGLIDEERILQLMSLARRQGIDLIITGRNASRQLQEAADLVTEMKEVKHPFYHGYPARKGFEY